MATRSCKGAAACIGRRGLLAGLLAAPGAARGQPGRVYQVAALEWDSQTGEDRLAPFRRALRELGFVEDGNLRIDYRFANQDPGRAAEIAAQMAAARPDVIVAFTTPSAHAARRATADIPIVFNAADPIGTGLVANLARPSGNLTGVSLMISDLEAKRVGLLHEALPGARRIVYLASRHDTAAPRFIAQAQAAGLRHGIEVAAVIVDSTGGIDLQLAGLAGTGIDAVVVQPLFTLSVASARGVAESALRHRMAAIGTFASFAHVGGLMAFGPSQGYSRRRAAHLVARILQGAHPGELPVEQPTEFHLAVNLATARHLGIAIPPLLLARADEVIE